MLVLRAHDRAEELEATLELLEVAQLDALRDKGLRTVLAVMRCICPCE